MAYEWVGPLVGGVIGFTSAIFAEPLRRRIFRPSLEVEFGPGSDYRSRTPVHVQMPAGPDGGLGEVISCEAEVIRVRVRNTATHVAEKVRAYLTNIEKRDGASFTRTQSCDSIPLSWSCRQPNQFDAIDLPTGVSQFIDVVSVHETNDQFDLSISTKHFRYSNLLKRPGEYRLTIQVSGNNVPPKTLMIGLKVEGGAWDDYTVWSAG